jgi:hypothetical protein
VAVRSGRHEPFLINLVLAKQTVLKQRAHDARLSPFFFAQPLAVYARVRQNGGADSVTDAYTHRVHAPPAPPMPPNVTTSQMFCNVSVFAPRSIKLWCLEQACITSTGLPRPRKPQPACDPQKDVYDLCFDVPDEFGSVLYRRGAGPHFGGEQYNSYN